MRTHNSPRFDIILWTAIVFLIAGGLVANYYFQEYSVALHLIGWILIAIISLGIVSLTKIGQVAWDFIKQARMELRKVVWPSRQETMKTTMIVAAMVAVMAIFLWGIDTFLLWFIGMLTGHAG